MPDSGEPLNEVRFKKFQDQAPPPGYEAMGGALIKPEYREFLQAAFDGKLPDPGPVPEQDPEVVALAAELMVIRLPEWKNPAGRKLGGPTQMKIGNAIRVAEYLRQRGVSFDPDKATVRWISTPGGHLGTDDPGKHIYRNEDGSWPEAPDAEEFWRIEDIATHQLPDGRWVAVHPRGIECTDASKTEAYSMCVQRLAAKVAELKGNP